MKTRFMLFPLALALAFVSCSGGLRSGLDPSAFEDVRDGKATALYTLTNAAGMEVSITNFGGRIVSVMVPDRKGEFRDVVLGFDKVQDYYPENNQTDFGASIGRHANRLDHGRISIDGQTWQLPQNNFGHCLHGGPEGWQYKVYEAVEQSKTRLRLKMVSPDGDSGFPGEVTAFVTFTLTEDNVIFISYEAETDAPTYVNLTNHSYFNLSGDPTRSICEDRLYINASAFTPVDSTFMTTGEIRPVAGTPMDFTVPKLIGTDIDAQDEQIANGRGYDHNWCLDNGGDRSVLAAELYSPYSGICLEVYTDEPGLQVYAGNFLDGTVTGKGGVTYGHRTAICLETQKYPDSPNKPDWKDGLLRPGEKYTSYCAYAFSVKANTVESGKDIRGYAGPVPVEVKVVNNEVKEVKALENDETPRYFKRASEVLDSWNGLSVKAAGKLEVDAVSGATYSSQAIVKNVRLALGEF